MNSGLRLILDSYGNETLHVPVRIEIVNAALKVVAERWAHAHDTAEIPLDPGLYGVRTWVSSGRRIDQVVEVGEALTSELHVPLHELSPHESHEWAFFTQRLDLPVDTTFSEPRYEGVWMRLWERSDIGWQVRPMSEDEVYRDPAAAEDGVIYRFRASEERLFALQTGGPHVPWRMTALPSTHEVVILIQPAPEPSAHPLQVAVSTDNWDVQTLLSLLQSGDTASAREWDKQSKTAEKLLFAKHTDTAAAAVGGYYLLRAREYERLHDWASNLASWFQWLPDGPVIHAWQFIVEGDRRDRREECLTAARDELLKAESRGFPLYSEGLRLLRDGLLTLDRRAKGEDAEVRAALSRVGAYTAAADWSASTTTFSGDAPDQPSESPRLGPPDQSRPMMYVFDVPLDALLHEQLLIPGDELQANLAKGTQHAKVGPDGTLQLSDGRAFPSLGALQVELTGQAHGAWQSWTVVSKGDSMDNLAERVRSRARSPIPPDADVPD